MNQIPGWLAVILAPGAGAFIWALFKGLDLWRNNTSAQESRAIRNLEKFAEREAFRADRALDLLDYWRSHAASCEYVIATNPNLGPDKIPTRPPLPPDPPRRILEPSEEVHKDDRGPSHSSHRR